MASEIRTFTWCDQCLSEDAHEPGQPVVVEASLDGGKAARFEADLCDSHRKSVQDALALLGAVGRVSAGTVRTEPDTYPCPMPGCTYVGVARHLLNTHTTGTHGRTLNELQGKSDLPCTVEGCTRKFSGPQGLAQHLIRTHGLPAPGSQVA